MKVRRLSAQRGQAARPRCPWCHQSASPSDLRVRCQGCQASLHLACAADAKACPTLGCRGPFSEATPRGRRLEPSPAGAALVACAAALALAGGAARLAAPSFTIAEPTPPPVAARVADPAPAGPPAYAPPSGASRGQLRAVQRAGDGSLEAWSADQIERGLGWLVASQAPDGAWWSDAHSPEGTTALAVAAFAASGSTHRSGPQRARVARALSWLCLRQDLGCFLTRSEDRPLLTLALSLLYMQTQDANLAQRLRRSATQVLGLKQDPVWSPVARSAAATALAKLGPPQQVERHEGGPAPDLVRALPHPQRWVANSWFAPPESPARAGWRAALVVHLHHLQHPAGPWTGEDDPGQLNLSWNTARNVLALALLAD